MGIGFVDLNTEQKQAVFLAQSGKSFFFFGEAGTGKSTTLSFIVQELAHANLEVAITASTGVAACQINGVTLHSFAGIGLGRGDDERLYKMLSNNKTARQKWMLLNTLIIDEISMLDPEYLDTLERLVSRLRGRVPFGGIQLIFIGDFSQLPPVRRSDDEGSRMVYSFQSRTWAKCIRDYVLLKTIHRQRDPQFMQILRNMRTGNLQPHDAQIIKDTYYNQLQNAYGIKPTQLYSMNHNVETMNQIELDRIPGEAQLLLAVDTGDADTLKMLKKYSRYTESLPLKVGAQVMLLQNLDVSRGLCNGSRGVVVGFRRSEMGAVVAVSVRFANGVLEHIYRHTDVRLNHNKRDHNGQPKSAMRSQFPLKLAWAITIHKSQGMTCDFLEVNLIGCFEFGQVYTALSRATSLKTTRVIGFEPSLVRCAPEVLEFERFVREQAAKNGDTPPERPVEKRKRARESNVAQISSFNMPM